MATPKPDDSWNVLDENAVEITDEDGGRFFKCEDPERFVRLHNDLIKMYQEEVTKRRLLQKQLNVIALLADLRSLP